MANKSGIKWAFPAEIVLLFVGISILFICWGLIYVLVILLFWHAFGIELPNPFEYLPTDWREKMSWLLPSGTARARYAWEQTIIDGINWALWGIGWTLWGVVAAYSSVNLLFLTITIRFQIAYLVAVAIFVILTLALVFLYLNPAFSKFHLLWFAPTALWVVRPLIEKKLLQKWPPR